MKNKALPIVLIFAVLVMLVYFIYQYRFKIKAQLQSSGVTDFLQTNLNIPINTTMADVSGIYSHINKWEGGLVNNPADPGGLTNRGITLATFKSLSPQLLGFQGTESDLRALTEDQWRLFIKYYWDKVCGDNIKDQCVANIIMDWYWGSGSWAISNVIRVLNSQFGYSITDPRIKSKMTQEIVNAINEQDPVEMYKALYNQRLAYYVNITEATPSLKVFLRGWNNRANDLQC